MKIAISAIGTANPEFKRSQKEAAELVSSALHLKPSEKRLLKFVYRATGIEHRYSVLGDYCREPGQFEFFPNDADAIFPTTAARMKIYKDNALNLALSAIENCFSTQENFDKNKITHLITVSCTGMYAPGLDIEITQRLDLNSTIKRTAINFMGCYGVFNALKVAESICKSEPHAKVLIVSVELCSIHFQKNTHIDNIVSNAIFADGAAAAIVETNPTQKKYFNLQGFHCDLIPQTNQEMAWQIADQGFDIVLTSYVPQVVESGIAAFADKLFKQHQIESQQIDLYAIHPGGFKILQACENALKITAEDNKYSYGVLRDFGNMSSATILFVLKGIWDDAVSSEHDKNIFSCAFGPGLTLESMFLKTHCV